MTKQQRIDIVNEIIKEISSRGRKFFMHDDKIAHLFLRNGRLYMKNEYNGKDMCLNLPDYRKPKDWHHGGTLWGLTQDFRDFVLSGDDINGENGYGGLYCPHWGYSSEDMEAIQAKAKELGYL